MPEHAAVPIRIINSVARFICDNGGWTDAWFAEYGKIFNIAVYPYVEVETVYPREAVRDRRLSCMPELWPKVRSVSAA